jgi:hypothetical protein
MKVFFLSIKKEMSTESHNFKCGLALFTFLRTYARRHNDTDPNSTVESWAETIQRVVSASNSQLHVGFTESELQELYNILYERKCSLGGRFLWQLGTHTVDKLGLPGMQNCGAIVMDNIKTFSWIMDLLMLGCVPPDTLVMTENGPNKIKDIQVGQKVWSFNRYTNSTELKEVLKIHNPYVPRDENIKISGIYGSLTTSKKHPILVYQSKNLWSFVEAGKIKVGDIITKIDGKKVSEDNGGIANIISNKKKLVIPFELNFIEREIPKQLR